jgi:hypothetical protein
MGDDTVEIQELAVSKEDTQQLIAWAQHVMQLRMQLESAEAFLAQGRENVVLRTLMAGGVTDAKGWVLEAQKDGRIVVKKTEPLTGGTYGRQIHEDAGIN